MRQQVHSKLVVGLMLLMAGLLGGYAWWHRYQSNPGCRMFWGNSLAAVEFAPTVEFMQLRSGDSRRATDSSGASIRESLVIGGTAWAVDERGEITRVPGLLHFRHALTQDSCFRWDIPVTDAEANWEFGLRMSGGPSTVTLLFARDTDAIWWVEGRRGLTLVAASAQAFHKQRDAWLNAAKGTAKLR